MSWALPNIWHTMLQVFFLCSPQDSSLLGLLGQSTSLPWHVVDISSYQNVTGYVRTHYQASLVLSQETSSQLVVKLLKIAAGFGSTLDGLHHKVSFIYHKLYKHLRLFFFMFNFFVIWLLCSLFVVGHDFEVPSVPPSDGAVFDFSGSEW